MTKDIDALVARLRERASSYRLSGPSAEHTASLLDEAANALDRLTAQLAAANAARDKAIIDLRNAREGAVIASGLQPGEVKELADAWDELHCCDDIPLDRGLASGIAALRYARDIVRERAERAEARLAAAEKALGALLAHYVEMVSSEDFALWDPEKEPVVIDARAALAQRTGGQDHE